MKQTGSLPRYVWLSLWLVFTALLLPAQPEGVALKRITTDDGLSHNYVASIARDTQGFMWFGTADGLTRYDGARCVVFRPVAGDSNSVSSNLILGLSLDPFGRLWVSTLKGLCLWDYEDRHFHRIPIKIPGHNKPVPVSHFHFDQKGYAWGTGDTFLLRINWRTMQVDRFNLPLGVGGGGTFVDSRGRIWVNIAGNLFRFFPETRRYEFQFGKTDPDPAKRTIAGFLCEDEHRRLWCSSWGNGLFRLNEDTGTFEDFPDGPAITTVFLFDRHPLAGPIVWAGGGVNGLYWRLMLENRDIHFPPRAKEPFSHNNTLARTVFKDTLTDIIWIGTDGGVEKYDPHDLKFTRIFFPDTIAPDQFSAISGIIKDPKHADRYWIAIWGKGFVEWNRRENHFRHFMEQKGKEANRGPRNNEIFDMAIDRHGKIWLAELGCVEEFDPETRRYRTFKPDFPTPGINHKVLEIMVGKDGQIWFGSNYEGLYRLDPVSGKSTYIPLDGKKNYIRALAEDPSGRLLVGLADGFIRYDPASGHFDHLLPTDTINYPCNDFIFDRQNRLWVATHEGLFRLDDQGRVAFVLNTTNGLQNKLVYGVEMDREDRFWLATGNGLCRYYPPTGRVDIYQRPDGLFDNDISGTLRMLPNGELFTGFQDAFNLANTSRLPVNPYPPRLAIAGVFVSNKPVPWRLGEPIVLRPGDNVVAFDIAALNYNQPGKTVLLYKLEGFDKEWVETRQNIITYTNLDGGDYTLLVHARNGDGFLSRQPVRMAIHVVPPFQKTVWFRLMILLLAGSVIGLLVYFRQEQRRRLEVIRRRIARDLHDDMGSTLSSIRFFSEVAQNQLDDRQAGVKNLLQRIGQSAASLSDAMQDIVWAINYRHDNLADLASRMREFGLRIGEARNIRFSADLPEDLQHRNLRPDQRRNIYLIFKEAVNNAAKYADCTGIQVRLQWSRNKIFMEIQDDGKGFDPKTVQQGNGLANMRQRAADIGGKLEIQTAPGKGVRVLLSVSL